MKNLFRHGDLLIRQIDKLPEGLLEEDTNVLAEGEFTGHRHTLEVDRPNLKVYTDSDGRKYFRVKKNAQLTHQEHQTITIERGIYVVEHEREFDPFQEEIRKVQD